MKNILVMCLFLLSSALNIANAEDSQGYFSALMGEGEYMIPITKIPEEPKSIVKNEISALVKKSIQDDLVRVLDIEYPILFKVPDRGSVNPTPSGGQGLVVCSGCAEL